MECILFLDMECIIWNVSYFSKYPHLHQATNSKVLTIVFVTSCKSLSSYNNTPFFLKCQCFVSKTWLFIPVDYPSSQHWPRAFLFGHAKLLKLCPTICDTLNCSPPGSSVSGILQARILEWVAVPSSEGSSQPRNQNHVSCVSCIGRRVLNDQRHLGSSFISCEFKKI